MVTFLNIFLHFKTMILNLAFPRRRECAITCVVSAGQLSLADNLLTTTILGTAENAANLSWQIITTIDHDIFEGTKRIRSDEPILICYAAVANTVLSNCKKICPLFYCNMTKEDVLRSQMLSVTEIHKKCFLNKTLTNEIYRHLIKYASLSSELPEAFVYKQFSKHLLNIHNVRDVLMQYFLNANSTNGLVAVMKYCLFCQGEEYVLSARALHRFYHDYSAITPDDGTLINLADSVNLSKNIKQLLNTRYNLDDHEFRKFVNYVRNRVLITDDIVEYLNNVNSSLSGDMFWLQYEILDFIQILQENAFFSDIISRDIPRISLLGSSVEASREIEIVKAGYKETTHALLKRYNFMTYFINNFDLRSSNDTLEFFQAKLRSYDPSIVGYLGKEMKERNAACVVPKLVNKGAAFNSMKKSWEEKFKAKMPVNQPTEDGFRRQLIMAASGQGLYLSAFGITQSTPMIRPVIGIPQNKNMSSWGYYMSDHSTWSAREKNQLFISVFRKTFEKHYDNMLKEIHSTLRYSKDCNVMASSEDLWSCMLSDLLGKFYKDYVKLEEPSCCHEMFNSDLAVFNVMFDIDMSDCTTENMPTFRDVCTITRELKKTLAFIVYISQASIKGETNVTMVELNQYLTNSSFIRDTQMYAYCCNSQLPMSSVHEPENDSYIRNTEGTKEQRILGALSRPISTKSLRIVAILPSNVCFENAEALKSYSQLINVYLKIGPVNDIASKFSRGLDEGFVDMAIYRKNGSCRLPHSSKQTGKEIFYPVFIADSSDTRELVASKCESLLFDRTIGLIHKNFYPDAFSMGNNLLLKGAMNYYNRKSYSTEELYEERILKTVSMLTNEKGFNKSAVIEFLLQKESATDINAAIKNAIHPILMQTIKRLNCSNSIDAIETALLKPREQVTNHLHIDLVATRYHGRNRAFKSCIFGNHSKYKPSRDVFYFLKVAYSNDSTLLVFFYYMCFTASCNANEPNPICRFPITI